MKEELTAFSELSTYINSIGGMEQIIEKMARELVKDPSSYTMGTKSTRRKVEVKRPLVERLEKLCVMISEHIKSVKQLNMHIDTYMPDPYFDYKDAEGITNRITLTTLRSYLGNAKEQARLDANYKLTPELAVIFNQYFKSVKPQ
jgi:DNA repair ATPase RecN